VLLYALYFHCFHLFSTEFTTWPWFSSLQLQLISLVFALAYEKFLSPGFWGQNFQSSKKSNFGWWIGSRLAGNGMILCQLFPEAVQDDQSVKTSMYTHLLIRWPKIDDIILALVSHNCLSYFSLLPLILSNCPTYFIVCSLASNLFVPLVFIVCLFISFW
jgi:hypothetical protein